MFIIYTLDKELMFTNMHVYVHRYISVLFDVIKEFTVL